MNPQDEQIDDSPLLGDEEDGSIEMELDPEDAAALQDSGLAEPTEDPAEALQQFNSNLAESISESELDSISLELIEAIEEDERGREEWNNNYKESLSYLGIKEEPRALPWNNACGVVEPSLLEGIVRFQSRASTKIFEQAGPTKLEVDAPMTNEIQLAVVKAQKKFNKYMTDSMPEFRAETEKLLFSQAQIGVGFKKNYFNTRYKRVVSQFVRAESLILPYGCECLETCERITEVVRKTMAQVTDLQRKGIYLNVDLNVGQEKLGEVEEAKTDLTAVTPSTTLQEGVKLYECHVDLWLEDDQFASEDGSPSPYIVTIEESSYKILSIRRNWKQDDTLRCKRAVFVPYTYVPSDGPYGYGLVQLVGQNCNAATKILRQLIDAGTLANVQAWFKSKQAKMSSQGPLQPGEIRDVDLDPDEMSKAFYPLPIKEPSQTLFQLLQVLIGKVESFASMSDLEISASSQNAPVGTTLAILERQTEISNAVQGRLYDSLRIEFRIIKEIMKEFQSDVYADIFGELEQLAGPCCVLPVGDPKSSTQSQRIIVLQQVSQLAMQAPQVYDLAALHRSMLTAMGMDDVEQLIPDTSKMQPMDPVSETSALLAGKPIQAFPEQDHASHIAFHQSVKQDPYLQQMLAQNPRAQEIAAANEAHIAQHLALQFAQEIQQRIGMQLQGQQQDPQTQAHIAQMAAGAVAQMVAQHQNQAQQQKAQQQAQDPAFQLALKEVDIKDKARQDKRDIAFAKLAHDTQSKQEKGRLEVVRIASQAEQAAQGNQTKLQIAGQSNDTDQARIAADGFKHIATVISSSSNSGSDDRQ